MADHLQDSIVCLGDSITQGAYNPEMFGYVSALQHSYSRRLDIVCRGFSGENIRHLFPRFVPSSSAESKVRLLIIFLGANDACLPGTEQHVSKDRYQENLAFMVNHQALWDHNPNIRILLIGPPPICEYRCRSRDQENGWQFPRRTAQHTREYAIAAKNVSQQLKVPFVDVWTEYMLRIGWKEGDPLIGSLTQPKSKLLGELLPDGLHPGGEGHRIIYAALMESIRANFPKLAPEALDFTISL